MSDSINIQVNKWKNNRWAWSHSTGTAAGCRTCLSLHPPCSPSLPHPLPLCTSMGMAATAGHSCFKHSEKSKTGQREAGNWEITAPGLPPRSQPGFPLMVQRGRWQQQRWHYQTIHRKQTSPVPVQMAAQAFWAIFGHFRRSPSSVRRTAAPSTPPQRISAQSIFLQSTLAPPTAVPPFPWEGAQLQQPPLLASSLFAFSQHQSGCILNLPAGPPPRGCKIPCCWSLVHKASWC